jgi:hypothetical protein
MKARLVCPVFLELPLLATILLCQTPTPSSGAGGDARDARKLGGIRGRVVGSDTGAGLSKTTLTLLSSELQGKERPVTARTNAEGEYEIKDLKPGRYYLRAMRRGYVPQAYGEKAKAGGPCPLGCS